MRRSLLVAAVVVISISVTAILTASGPSPEQPIAYNHHLHVEDQGLVCTDCHRYAEEHTKATIPSLSVCMDCHDVDPLSDSPEEAKLIGYLESETEIPWVQIYSVPDHVYFSHRRHVVLGELDCVTCHGRVAEFETPIVSQSQDLTMEWCMDCHRASGASNDCIACHR